jgi:hypothetical protein
MLESRCTTALQLRDIYNATMEDTYVVLTMRLNYDVGPTSGRL